MILKKVMKMEKHKIRKIKLKKHLIKIRMIVKINKIYRKDITIPDDDVQTLLERVLDKIKQHKADGYSL